ncbi:transposase [Azotobacter chroococcum]|uniref:transposase n=1 Tax=Azotobacter chroococcum TaxID=353 RepID=UPI0010ADB719|nr:transposase [Azotobacter chroococcum]TKD44884.1 transposase [Azotobacter chroococcum]
MPFSIHQRAAFTWLLASSIAFAPVLQIAKRPDAGMFLAQGIALVTLMIAVVPMLLKWPQFRRWFCWTDALSDRQRQAIAQRDLRRYYQCAYDERYLTSVLPYIKRIAVPAVVLLALPPKVDGFAALEVVSVFAPLYPMAVVLLIFASCPVGRILRARP